MIWNHDNFQFETYNLEKFIDFEKIIFIQMKKKSCIGAIIYS
jgi:hypothetical protein